MFDASEHPSFSPILSHKPLRAVLEVVMETPLLQVVSFHVPNLTLLPRLCQPQAAYGKPSVHCPTPRCRDKPHFLDLLLNEQEILLCCCSAGPLLLSGASISVMNCRGLGYLLVPAVPTATRQDCATRKLPENLIIQLLGPKIFGSAFAHGSPRQISGSSQMIRRTTPTS